MTVEDLRAKMAQRAESLKATQPNETMMKAVANAAAKWKASQMPEPSNFEKGWRSMAGAGTTAALGVKEKLLGLSPEEETRREEINQYINKAGWPGIIGSGVTEAVNLAPAAVFGAPAAMGALGRSTLASGLASLYAPTNEQAESAKEAFFGQLGGETLGKTIPHAVNLGKKVYEGVAGMLHAPTAAAQTLGKFADVPGRSIPETVDLSRTYKNIPELKPTLGMMVPEDQRSLLEFENYVRTKFGKTALAEADIYNQQAILKGLQERAFDPTQATKEMELLNAETGALRKTAFDLARQKTSEELANPILRETSAIRTRPGETGLGSPAAQTTASGIEGIALGPVSKKSVIGAGGLAVDIPVFARKVDPANLYAARKTIDDTLRGAVGPNDELGNAIKANKVVSMELKGAIDEALKAASAGNWEKYLDTYIEKIKPIEEGKAFQGVLELFKTAPRIPGSTLASISPYKMRKAASEATYKEIGTSLKDILSPEGRSFLDDAANAMSAIENVRSGLTATNNSATASRLYEIARNVPKAIQPVINAGLAAVDILTKNKSQEIIVDALKNPENFQAIVNRYNKMNKVPISPAQAKGLQVLLGSVGAGAAQQGRR
jgi:hypothetical protein